MQAFARWAEDIHTLRPRHRLLICAALGALAALGQAPVGFWPATILGLALILGICLRAATLRQAALAGWAFGTGYYMLALSWIIEPFLVDIARHGWMAPFALVFMAAGLALFWAAASGAARRAGGAVAWIAALTLAEAARTYVFTGFPWAQVGHAWIATPMLQWASVAGALGLTALIGFASASLWWLLSGAARRGTAGLALVAALYAGGALIVPAPADLAGRPTVRLVQPNAAQHEKWDPTKVQQFFERQVAYTRAAPRPDLIVWPETAVPVLLAAAEPTLDAIARAAAGVPVVLGIRRLDGQRLYNSLIVLDANGKTAALYDKYHLVPFGEYIPYGERLAKFGLTGLAATEGFGFSPGPGAQLINIGTLGRALPLICYEGVFPQDLRAAPGRADFILLITNDAWFGQVSGPYQHLAQARLRSVEQGLPMIRVANTGVSAMIDSAGRVLAEIPLGQAGWIDAALPPPAPPTIYARTGDLAIVGLMLAALLLAFLYNRRAARTT